MTGVVVGAVAAVFCITGIIMLGMVLRFGRWLVEKADGDPKSLRDAAVLLRAFRPAPGGLLSTLTKIFKRT